MPRTIVNITRSKRENRAFSFIELIVSAVILSLGIGIATKMMLWSKVDYLQFEDRSRATNLAYNTLQKYLSFSYDRLGRDCTVAGCTLSNPIGRGLLMRETGVSPDNFNWEARVYQEFETNTTGRRIPYKFIEVVASYLETGKDIKNSPVRRMFTRMTQIVTYPYLHTQQIRIGSGTAEVTEEPLTSTTGQEIRGKDLLGGTLNLIPLSLNVRFETPKNLIISYNISLDVEDNTNLEPEETIITHCRIIDNLSGAIQIIPVQTRTPISSQPTINNLLALTGRVQANRDYTIEVRWFKEPGAGGRVILSEANLMVIAYEDSPS